MAKRLKAMGNARYEHGFKLTLHEDLLHVPSGWKSPKLIFVNSMSDLFHEDVPIDFLQRVFETMRNCPQHVFQVLTKRAERLESVSHLFDWPDNVWMGVSVEDHRVKERIDYLSRTSAKVKFLSCEPLIGPVGHLNLNSIDWVIAGGESGPKSRPMHIDWVQDIKHQCAEANVAFFFKQWGGVRKDLTGRELDGRTYSEFPTTHPAVLAHKNVA
jgi:protein gp37